MRVPSGENVPPLVWLVWWILSIRSTYLVWSGKGWDSIEDIDP